MTLERGGVRYSPDVHGIGVWMSGPCTRLHGLRAQGIGNQRHAHRRAGRGSQAKSRLICDLCMVAYGVLTVSVSACDELAFDPSLCPTFLFAPNDTLWLGAAASFPHTHQGKSFQSALLVEVLRRIL